MSRIEFLNELAKYLQDVPEMERREILADYEEHFYNAMASGKSEAEVSLSLGSPKVIAKESIAHYHIHQVQQDTSIRSVGRAATAAVSLGFFNVLFVLGPAVALLSVIIALFAVAFVLLIMPPALLFVYFFIDQSVDLPIIISASMVTGGLGMMLGVAMVYMSKWTYRLFVSYLKWNLKIVKG